MKGLTDAYGSSTRLRAVLAAEPMLAEHLNALVLFEAPSV